MFSLCPFSRRDTALTPVVDGSGATSLTSAALTGCRACPGWIRQRRKEAATGLTKLDPANDWLHARTHGLVERTRRRSGLACTIRTRTHVNSTRTCVALCSMIAIHSSRRAHRRRLSSRHPRPYCRLQLPGLHVLRIRRLALPRVGCRTRACAISSRLISSGTADGHEQHVRGCYAIRVGSAQLPCRWRSRNRTLHRCPISAIRTFLDHASDMDSCGLSEEAGAVSPGSRRSHCDGHGSGRTQCPGSRTCWRRVRSSAKPARCNTPGVSERVRELCSPRSRPRFSSLNRTLFITSPVGTSAAAAPLSCSVRDDGKPRGGLHVRGGGGHPRAGGGCSRRYVDFASTVGRRGHVQSVCPIRPAVSLRLGLRLGSVRLL